MAQPLDPTVVTRITATIAAEIGCRPAQVEAAVGLLDEGATVPFVARYRKEVTGGLDDTQLRTLEERLGYLREMETRRAAVVESIRAQGKLDAELAGKLARATSKAEIEDLYLPFKPKRRTRAEIAREKGLGPLAERILADRSVDPKALAEGFVTAEVADVKAALDGARDILAEQFAENADLVGRLRGHMQGRARLRARVVEGKEAAGEKFADYFDHVERWADVPSHRALAMLRGRNEEVLALDLEVDADDPAPVKPVEAIIAETFGIPVPTPSRATGAADKWLLDVARWCWRVKLSLSLSVELMGAMRERAEEEAIRVFAANLKDLLLAAPAGTRATLGLDPGIRTGVKVAVVDATSKVVATTTVYPFPPKQDVQGTLATLKHLIQKHHVELVAIGNGTGSRETDRLVSMLIGEMGDRKPIKVVVSEAGASVYSASALAAAEMPDLDVSLRGAVSIARRLQDPLAELVKIDPKAIGVGQYQHDVDQARLAKMLDAVVEDAVNAVGVDLNTASASLLTRVSGLGASLAEAIVAHREANGPFRNRRQLLEVARLGPKTFEQAAGFLRIRDGDEPLDTSSVHPEAYAVAKRIVKDCGRDLRALMGDAAALKAIDPRKFVDERFGLPTVKDILSELEKPGRDPRPGFKTAAFAEGIEKIEDLRPGMVLEGTVTNVAAFGAFVDIGVHQDGLVHVSQLADRFVKDPREVVKAGDVVKVRVVEVDAKRKRIGLTMRKDDGGARMGPPPGGRDDRPRGGGGPGPKGGRPGSAPPSNGPGALGAALLDALRKK
ncbi:Tex family protein [Pinisolibacter aquiterrae]|uniref:Tex family protein n=1 Tax=Pinisolibacter aquiterrae TaxID=2815579 RepID=UPI001C3E71F2|nr:Tex family protein [Pinisolibacter aquiterrae]MBV5265619.1 RNA-binding transcriptional accessory protein [Pinisolibacter aquiterrae]MCC8236816.1 RNA-binding transcriptional accessory protein [Pinisolibacter aquiterrae]